MVTVSHPSFPAAKATAHLQSKGSVTFIMNPEILTITVAQEGSVSGH